MLLGLINAENEADVGVEMEEATLELLIDRVGNVSRGIGCGG
jgi:hypothetical protein